MAEDPEPARARWLELSRRIGLFLVRLPRPLALCLPLAWMVLIWALSASSLPSPDAVPSLAWRLFANLGHAPMFGLLGLFAAGFVLPRSKEALVVVGAVPALLCVGWVVLYGVLDEWHQAHTPGRHPSALDVLTDAVGGVCVLWIVRYVSSPVAEESGLRTRLGAGLVLCLVAALLATFAGG